MNNCVLVGRLTKDPELRFIPNSGKAVARFSIAVNRDFSKEKEADFFNIVVWDKAAESCANFLEKGLLVAINGNLRNNNYEDKSGTKHFGMEVVAQKVEFLEWKDKKDNQKETSNEDNMSGFQAIDNTDDIPF